METLALLLLSLTSVIVSPNGSVTISWANLNPPGAVQVSKLYRSTNVAGSVKNWILIATIPGGVTNLNITVTPGVNHFALTSSNSLGETAFSAEVATFRCPKCGYLESYP